MSERRRIVFVAVSALLVVFLLGAADVALRLPYVWKAALKILVLCALFSLYRRRFARRLRDDLVGTGRVDRGRLLRLLLLGAATFLTVLVVYRLTQHGIDAGAITESLVEKYRITRGDVLVYGLYLSFVNALLEELFFRGYLFLNLLGAKRWPAYAFSSVLFSVYHLANIAGWFRPPLFLAALAGLAGAGALFCWLDARVRSIWPGYVVHLFADLAIVVVGWRLLGAA